MFKRIYVIIFYTFFAAVGGLSENIYAVSNFCQEPSMGYLLAAYKNDSRPYSSVAWLTSHNSFANKEEGWRYNQQTLSFEKQYAYGVRSFMLDLHIYRPGGEEHSYIALCHGRCSGYQPSGLTNIIPPTPLLGYLRIIAKWLEEDPTEIITLHLESYTGKQGTGLLSMVFQESGVDKYLFPLTLDPNDETITLGKMRQENQRLVVFSDNRADPVLNVDRYRETKYSLGEFSQCEMRGEGRDLRKKLFVLNHFYTLSYNVEKTPYSDINSFNNIMRRVALCFEEQRRYPNFVVVDFVEEGSHGGAREAVLALNTYVNNSCALIDSTKPLEPSHLPDNHLSLISDRATLFTPWGFFYGLPGIIYFKYRTFLQKDLSCGLASKLGSLCRHPEWRIDLGSFLPFFPLAFTGHLLQEYVFGHYIPMKVFGPLFMCLGSLATRVLMKETERRRDNFLLPTHRE